MNFIATHKTVKIRASVSRITTVIYFFCNLKYFNFYFNLSSVLIMHYFAIHFVWTFNEYSRINFSFSKN